MRISFFEEFPTKDHLEKAKLLSFPTRIILGAKSAEEYLDIVKKSTLPKGTKFAYWPILEEKEGYWLSPFSDYNAVKRVISEIKGPMDIMWDAELPMLKKSLFLRNLSSFFRTKKLIHRFLLNAKKKKINVEVAELPITSTLTRGILRFLGVDFPRKFKHTSILMGYQSFTPKRLRSGFLKRVIGFTKKHPRPHIVGLGVITTGILGFEKTITPTELQKSLKKCKDAGIDEAVIFRLGGLDSEYVKAIEAVHNG